MRRLKKEKTGEKTGIYAWPEKCGYWRVMKNFAIIQLGRYCPFLQVKSWMYEHGLGMKLGNQVGLGLMVMVDVFFPDRIFIGDNTSIGYNATILTHETTVDEFRTGDVKIGKNVLIGANATILAGVEIGDGAVVGAGSVVSRDIPANVFVVGVPAEIKAKLKLENQMEVK